MTMHSRSAFAAVAAGLLLVACWAACVAYRRAPSATLNVLVITLDTTRADRLGAYGNVQVATPNLDWLAHTGVLFEQATTVAPLTLPAHCSLFTGRLPPGHGVRDNNGFALAQSHVTLAEILKANGFRTGAFPSSLVLDRRFGVNRGFDEYADDFDTRGGDPLATRALRRPANETVDRAIAWITDSSSAPFFAWVHFYDAHAPYEPPEPYRTRYAGRPYDGCVAFMDAQVGRLVGWLSQHGLLERTAIIVVADHGESLGEHGEWTHALRLYQSVLHVPLIMRVPTLARKGRRIAALVRSVDVMPTVLSLLGMRSAPGVDGVSLTPLMNGTTDDLGLEAYAETLYPELHLGLAAGWMIRAGRLKLIRQAGLELYDVIADPCETHNLGTTNRALVEGLDARLAGLRAGDGHTAPRIEVDTDRQQRLAALGYISR